jgi:hypothetical protein
MLRNNFCRVKYWALLLEMLLWVIFLCRFKCLSVFSWKFKEKNYQGLVDKIFNGYYYTLPIIHLHQGQRKTHTSGPHIGTYLVFLSWSAQILSTHDIASLDFDMVKDLGFRVFQSWKKYTFLFSLGQKIKPIKKTEKKS